MRVVLDTYVFISAIFFTGPPSRILSAWIADQFDLVVSTEILEDYREAACRIGARFPGVELDPVLDRIALHALLVAPVPLPHDACADRGDIKFLGALTPRRSDSMPPCMTRRTRQFCRSSSRKSFRAFGARGTSRRPNEFSWPCQ